MKIAICDDSESCLVLAKEATAEYAEKNGDKNVTFRVFSHGEDLLDEVHKGGGFDIYVLDIVMPHINGIELGLKLREDGYNGKIVYLTSSEEFAIDSYRVKAHDYLMKPINKTGYFKVLDDLHEQIKVKEDKSIIVKTKSNSIKLTFDSILYAELSKRAVSYHLTNGKTVESVSMRVPFTEAIKPLSQDRRFAVCGQSMVSNLSHITMVESDAIVFLDKIKVPLGVKICREIRSIWTDFWFNGEK